MIPTSLKPIFQLKRVMGRFNQSAHRKKIARRAGFTLIELLIASLLVTVVILVAWSGFIAVLNLSKQAEAKTLRQFEVNRAVDFISQEIRTAQYVNQTATQIVDGVSTQVSDLLSHEGFNLSKLGNYGDLALYLELPATTQVPAICPAGGPNAGSPPPSPSEFDRVVYDVRPSSSEWLGPRILMRYGRFKSQDGTFNPCENPFSSDPIADALSDDTSQTPTCSGILTGGSGFYTCNTDGVTQLLFQHSLLENSMTTVSTDVAPRIQSIQPQPGIQSNCSNESQLRSLNDSSPTNISFVNQLSKTLKLYRLDAVGNRVLMSTLNSGQQASHNTFLTHPWVVTDTNDTCLGIFMPSTNSNLVTLSDSLLTTSVAPSSTNIVSTSTTVVPSATDVPSTPASVPSLPSKPVKFFDDDD